MIYKHCILALSIVSLVTPLVAQPTHVSLWEGDVTLAYYDPLSEFKTVEEVLVEEVVVSAPTPRLRNTTWKTLERYHYSLWSFAWFTAGYCTAYAASQRPDLALYEDGTRRLSGNARDRLSRAQQTWLSTGTTPQVWAIAVYAPGRWATGLGHVGIVQEVRDDGTIVLRDMNYAGKHIVTVRIVSASLAQWYIY